jgi:hypothetical protein
MRGSIPVDAIALASVLTSGVVGLSGLGFGLWNGSEDRKARSQDARDEQEHQRKLGREQRIFDRRSDVYVSLLTNLEREVSSAERIYPLMGPAPAPPTALNEDEWMALKASIRAFGSREVQLLLGEFNAVVSEFAGAWRACETLEKAGLRHTDDFSKSFQTLDKARRRLREELLSKIEVRVNQELTSAAT